MSNGVPHAAALVLDALAVPRNQVLYVQSSVDWIQKAGLGAAETLSALLEWVGDRGTLVMPSYPFHSTHEEYLASGPTFDVRRTPSVIGLLPEMFRRTKGVSRSLDPDFSVTAYGDQAAAIAGTAPAAPDPFGPDSSYQRMLDRHTTVVGLGVSLNTSSFIHLIDSRSESGYPAPVYHESMYTVAVTDAGGRSIEVPRKALRQEFQRLTAPSRINTAMSPPPAVFATIEINEARFFRWDLDAWASWCLDHARQQAAAREWPCWLSRLA